MKRTAWLLPLLALAVWANAATPTLAPETEPDKCMAKICLETPVNQQEIVARYGPGDETVPYPSDPGHVRRCYYDRRQHLYIEFDFDKRQQHYTAHHSDLVGIMVSLVPMCAEKYTAKRLFPPFETEHGLGIGATQASLQAAMGKPHDTRNMLRRDRLNSGHRTAGQPANDRESAAYGEKALTYNPDPEHELLQDVFYFSHGKVKSILISDSE